VAHLRDAVELLVKALEELEARRCEDCRETLREAGAKLLELGEPVTRERRLVAKLVNRLLQLAELGEERQP
jgi:hypothetical protein